MSWHVEREWIALNWINHTQYKWCWNKAICTGTLCLQHQTVDGKYVTHWSVAEKKISGWVFPKVNLQTDKLLTDEIYTNGSAYSSSKLLDVPGEILRQATAVCCSRVFRLNGRNSQSAFLHIFRAKETTWWRHGKTGPEFVKRTWPKNINRAFIFGSQRAAAISTAEFIKRTGNTPIEYAQRGKDRISKKKAFRNKP